MQGVLHGVVFMDHGAYGEGVTRRDGSLVHYIACYDEDSAEIVRFSVAQDFEGEIPEKFTPVEVTFRGNVRQEASVGQDGRAFARGSSVKLQALAIAPASA